MLTDLLHRWAAVLIARGEHAELLRVMAAVERGPASTDPWLPLISAQIQLGRGDRAAALADVRRSPAVPPGSDDPDRRQFRDATTGLAGVGGPSTEDVRAPEDTGLTALQLVGRGAAGVFAFAAGAHGPDGIATALSDLEAALSTARDRTWGCWRSRASASSAPGP